MILDDRLEIQECLNHGMTFKAIGTRIGKDQTTVSKEVKKHLTIIDCDVKRFDRSGSPLPPKICPQLLRPPFVCNPCKRKNYNCAFQKHIYRAKPSQRDYEECLVEARTGIPLNKEEFYEIDRIISNGVGRGQHLYHILQTNNLGVSKSTVYRHLKRGYLSISAVDFPRVVKFKARKQRQGDYVPKNVKVGRTYENFLALTEEKGISSWIEMDTVIGRPGGKAILTLDFTFCNFMAGLLLENKTACEVAEKITWLKNKLAASDIRFGDIFSLILTDNGGEFSNVFAVENAPNGEKECDLFFCDPYQSSQKPRVEKNHTLFRDIVPKGESFDHFSQDTVNLIFSHVNSVKRKILNGKTPFEVFAFTYGFAVANILGIRPILAAEVIQSPRLLKT